MESSSSTYTMISTRLAFLLVSFSLGQLGDGLNIFQGIYLVGVGWEEGAVGTALSLMGLTSLMMQPFAGNWVDTTTIDRRWFLVLASIITACSASTILFVHPTQLNHALIYTSKFVEGIASSFIIPCLAALTMASFGPTHFDEVMASNIYWGHVGSVAAAVLAGIVAVVSFPHVEYSFLVIGGSALVAIIFVRYLPQGNPLWGRGLDMSSPTDSDTEAGNSRSEDSDDYEIPMETTPLAPSNSTRDDTPQVASYWQVLTEYKTLILCVTGFFYHFANANVLLVLGEIMGQGGKEQVGLTRYAIPLTAGAIVTAQFTMAVATYVAGEYTEKGWGRKPLFLIGIASLPIRCALIILLKDAGHQYLVATQILDGVGGGLFGVIHPFIVADITFGTGRFNAVMGLTASAFGLGATLSNFLGQRVAEHFGYVHSLMGSFVLSFVPIIIFAMFMPETLGKRGGTKCVALHV
jgi:MFS family permease